MLIGICGKSGSGKTTLANMFVEKKNFVHINIDKIGHKVLLIDTVKEKLVTAFGTKVINNGNIDRKELGKIVFNSKDAMDKLTEITWDEMQKEIDKILSQNSLINYILDWQLLPLSIYFEKCDATILLDIPYEERLRRATIRDNITKDAFDLREKASLDISNYSFDYVITDGNYDIEGMVDKICLK